MTDCVAASLSNSPQAGRTDDAAATAPLVTVPQTVHAWVREHARRRPHGVAVRQGDVELTYRDLDQLSDVVAQQLAGRGTGPGHLVPVALTRSPLLVAVLLGVLKTGAAYAAVDPDWPQDRLRRVLAVLNSPVVVTTDGTGDDRAWDPRSVWGAPRAAPLVDTVGSQDPCCVFFTSGTTGEPKGVVVPHAGTVRLFQDCAFAELGPGAVMLQSSPLPWDGLTFELWSMLVTGGTALLREDPPMTGSTVRTALADGLSLLWLTASLFNLLVDEDLGCFTGLAHLLIGGERLSVAHVDRFLQAHPTTRLTNGYGPVEATCFVTTHDIRPGDPRSRHGIPLGTAVADTVVHVLDDSGRSCADGEVGELWVSGPRVALGYLGLPEHPAFAVRNVDGKPRRGYATGDVALSEGGLLHFLGRRDRQVKLRGHRIEPAEVEAAVASLPGVLACHVVPMVEGGVARGLAAFWSGPCDDALERRLRTHLEVTLPAHQRPDALHRVERFPLTANGKLDERLLLEQVRQLAQDRAEVQSSVGAGDPQIPATSDSRIAAILREEAASVLRLPGLPGGQSLTELGATSLDVTRLAMRLERRLGFPVRVGDLAEASGAEDLVHLLEHEQVIQPAGRPDPHDAPVHAAPIAGSGLAVPLDPVQTAFLMQQIGRPQDTSSLCLMLWRLNGAAAADSIAFLRMALQDVQDRHESLRSCYLLDHQPVAVPMPATTACRLELAEVAGDGAEQARAAVLQALTGQPLDLGTGRVWRAAVSRVLGTDDVLLGLAVHHVAFDGWSEAVLADELSTALEARSAGRPAAWLRPAPTLAALAAERSRRDRHRVDPELAEPWRDHLAPTSTLVVREPAEPCSGVCLPDAHSWRAFAGDGALRPWRDLAREQRCSLFPVLIAVLAEAMRPEILEPQIVLGVPVAARESVVEEHAVGCLIDTLSVRLPSLAGADWAARVRAAREEVDWSRAHAGVAFPDLVRLLAPARSVRSPIYQVMFAQQDNTDPDLRVPGCTSTFERPQAPHSAAELLIEVSPTPKDGLEIVVAYQCATVGPAVARRLVESLADLISRGPLAPLDVAP